MNTNMLPVYTMTIVNCLVNPSNNVWVPLDGEYFGRPERRPFQPFGAIGAGRPTHSTIADHLVPVPTCPTISPTDFIFPRFVWDARRKREFDIEVLREMLTASLGTLGIASPPQVATPSPEEGEFCHICDSDEAFDENEPPALLYHDEESDSSEEIVPPPVSRVNRGPFSVLFVKRETGARRRISGESGYSSSPPSEEVQQAILGPRHAVEHISIEQSDATPVALVLGHQDITKKDTPRGLARIRAKAPRRIDPGIANGTNKLPETVMISSGGETAADILSDILSNAWHGIDKEENTGPIPHAPMMNNIPLPLASPNDFGFFDGSNWPMTPRRQTLLDVLNIY